MGSGELASLIAAMIWACTSVALTSLSARTSPVVLSGLRLAFGSVVVAIVLLVSGQAGGLRDASNGTLAGVILSGLIGYGLGDTVYIVALKRVGMQRTFPITMALFIGLTVIGGVVLLGEDLSWGLPAGALFIGSGVYFLVVPANDANDATLAESRSLAVAAFPDAMGYALLVAVGVLWTIATLWLANARGDLEPIAAGAIRTPAGATALLGFAMATQRPSLAAPFRNRNHLAAIVAAGAVGTGLGSLLYVYGVLEAGAAQAAVLSATSPLMALPLSIVFLGERFTPKVGLGTVLCVGGIVLVVLG
ncbi:MAG: DMT family transporter [Dehalococcoidia bacterium]|uniref:DMT family transporter n=1 Tax=Candidatus Amarobacter glycogenicus TaxID=3140699 RepID=UPI003136A815|nr:DMT family transporter [Dehalococcoidia bacterium]